MIYMIYIFRRVYRRNIQGRFEVLSEREENPYLQVYGFHYEVETTTAKRRSLEEYLHLLVHVLSQTTYNNYSHNSNTNIQNISNLSI